MAADRELENLKGAITLGAQALKSLELVNGGAAIAILTFYGNVTARNVGGITLHKGALKCALASFGLGVAAAILASCFGYISQLLVATGGAEKNEIRSRIVAVVLGLVSASLFIVGLLRAGASFD